MKLFYQYSSSKLRWIKLYDEGHMKFESEDMHHPYNNEEVERVKIQIPVDKCIISIRSAERYEQDENERKAFSKGSYFVLISDVHEKEQLMTIYEYSWDEVINIISLLKDLSFDAAKKVWKSKKL